jgi:hypothetical protein
LALFDNLNLSDAVQDTDQSDFAGRVWKISEQEAQKYLETELTNLGARTGLTATPTTTKTSSFASQLVFLASKLHLGQAAVVVTKPKYPLLVGFVRSGFNEALAMLCLEDSTFLFQNSHPHDRQTTWRHSVDEIGLELNETVSTSRISLRCFFVRKTKWLTDCVLPQLCESRDLNACFRNIAKATRRKSRVSSTSLVEGSNHVLVANPTKPFFAEDRRSFWTTAKKLALALVWKPPSLQ